MCVQDNTEVEVARCSRGQYFGELALVTNKPRAASVYAVGETKCLGKTPVFVVLIVLKQSHKHLQLVKHNAEQFVSVTHI